MATVESDLFRLVSDLESKGFLGLRSSSFKTFLSTGFDSLDELLGGGLRGGEICELNGPSGATSMALSMVASATRRGEWVAWIDAFGTLDLRSLKSSGAVLKRCLWVRLGQKRVTKESLMATEDILGTGAFLWVVIDMRRIPAGRHLAPSSLWFRLSRRLATTPTVCLLLGTRASASSCRLQCQRLSGGNFAIELYLAKCRGRSPGKRISLLVCPPVD
jgi:hypothetical protein